MVCDIDRGIQIPKSFKLHGITYRVVIKDDHSSRTDNLGTASYRFDDITLQSVVPGAPMSSERQAQVFFHELVHHILREMGSKKRDDERFVDLFASLLHQALSSASYEEVCGVKEE